MAQLYSQYSSGTQFTAGIIAGSVLGTSGLNPLVDRLNSISTDNNLITGSFISGTSTKIYSASINDADFNSSNLSAQQLFAGEIYIAGDDNNVDTIVLDTSSGTGIDFVTNDYSDFISSKLFFNGPTNGSFSFNVVYSGADGNFSSTPTSSNHGGAGGFGVIDINIGQAGTTNASIIEHTNVSKGAIRTFDRAGSFFFIGSAIDNSVRYSYILNGYKTI